MSSVGHFLLERNLTSVVLLYISPLSTEIAKTTYSAAYRLRGSNSRPFGCKPNTLPTELSLHIFIFHFLYYYYNKNFLFFQIVRL